MHISRAHITKRKRCFNVKSSRDLARVLIAFEVLTINCPIYFINLFIFNYLTLNIKLMIFKLIDVKFLFSKNHVFCKLKRTAVYGLMDARPSFRILKSPGIMMTCYLRDINKFLMDRTLCKSRLKCGFSTKSIELTRFVLFEVLGVPQLWDTSVLTNLVGSVQKFAKHQWDYGIRNFIVFDKFVRLCSCSLHG